MTMGCRCTGVITLVPGEIASAALTNGAMFLSMFACWENPYGGPFLNPRRPPPP